jgi:hypothetical protein
MDATALFGDLSLYRDGMKMERQKENEEQDSRTNTAPQGIRILHAGNEHGLEPKQCCFRCQRKITAIEVTGSRSNAGFL